MAGRLGRAGAPDRGGHDMTRAAPHAELAVGVLPIALLLGAVAGLRPSGWRRRRCCRRRGGVRAAVPSSSAIRHFCRMRATTLFRLFAGFRHRGRGRRGPRVLRRRATAPSRPLLTPVVRVLAPVPKIALYPAFILILGFEHASKIALVVGGRAVPDPARDLSGRMAVEPKLVWSARAAGASQAQGAVHRGAAGGAALGPDRLPHRPRDLLHRGVPGGDDHARPTGSGTCWSAPRATSRPSTCSCR